MATPRKLKMESPTRLSTGKDATPRIGSVVKPLQVRNIQEEDFELTPTNKRVKGISFDFNAPKYHDFTADESTQDVDKWFDERTFPDQADSPSENHAVNLLEEPSFEMESPEKEVKKKKPTRLSNTVRTHSMNLRKRVLTKNVGVAKKVTKKPTLTVPKPFKLHDTKRFQQKEADTPTSPFVPLAIKVQKFEKDTPDRFKGKPKAIKRILQNKLTQPKSPILSTRLRAKQNKSNLKPREVLEVEELKKVKPFKARPLNRKEEIVIPPSELTVPMSPAIQKPKPKLIKEPSPVKIKANPVPDLSKPFVPKIEHRVLPEPEFSLPGDEILKKKREELNEKLRKQEEEDKKNRTFKAKRVALPEKVSMDSSKAFTINHEIKVTEPVPFHLETDFRGEVYQQQFEKKVKEMTAVKEFHAKPLPNLEPFVPKRSEKALTKVQEFALNTDVRAEERKRYEEEQAKRLQEEEETRKELEKRKEENEKKELRQLRRQVVHKAQPVKKYAGVEIKPSDKPLTEPKTPRFARKRKH